MSDARLVSGSFGWAATLTCPADRSQRCRSRLFLTTDFGASWADVSPPNMGPFVVEVWFLDAQRGWLIAGDTETTRGIIYRTGNGGATWTEIGAAHIPIHAGSAVWIRFVDDAHGWLEEMDPVGSGAGFVRTEDGGTTWSEDPRTGWQGHVPWDRNYKLWRTRDGGRTWAEQALAVPPGYDHVRPDTPVFFGETRGVLPSKVVQPQRADVAFHRTADGGETWTPGPLLQTDAVNADSSPYFEGPDFSASLPTPHVWWVSTIGDRPGLYRSDDGGATWSKPAGQGLPAGGSIWAIDARSAWVLTLQGLFASSDAGATWRQLEVP